MTDTIELEFMPNVPDKVANQFLHNVYAAHISDCCSDPCLIWARGDIKTSGWINDGMHIHNFTGENNASRAAYILFHGNFERDLWILHHCDVKSCVNPKHLYIGTVKDNVIDAYARNRMNLPVGEQYSYSKLLNEEVVEIRNLHATGLYSCTKLADMFGISRSHAWRVVNNQRRKKG